MSETTNQTQSGVGALVAAKLAEAPKSGKAKDSRGKFMVYLDDAENEKLTGIAKVLSSGKIELGSQLFKIAINDAHKQLVKAGKLNEDGSIVGAPAEAPKAPASKGAAEAGK